MPEDGTKGLGDLADTLRRVPAAVPTRMPRPGDTFAGRYQIERLLGRGGMGVVYLATQAPLGRQVALKVLKPPESLEDDPQFDERFLREAAAAARLSHPNTITIHDFGQDDEGALYIVMEFLEGNDVRTVLAHEGTFDPARAIHVAKQVAKSLREAHRKGIIHRDLKPANVLLVTRDEDEDFVKVLDFGLVKFRGEASEITLAGKFLGSPRYTSPEALDRNREVDHRADIYAIGILLYTMITGAPPFDGDPMQVLHAHLHEKPRPMYRANPAAQTTPELEALVERCLEKEPDRRYQTMTDLLTALREVGAYFGQEDTETLDLEVNDSLEFDLDSGEHASPAVRRPRPDPSAKTRKPKGTRLSKPAAPTPSGVNEPPPKRKKRRGASPVPWVLGGAALALSVAIVILVVLPDDPEPAPLVAPDVGEIEVAGSAYLDVNVTSTPPGADVRIGFDGNWTLVGTTPVALADFKTPDEYSIIGLKLSMAGHEPVETMLTAAGGAVTWSGALTPEPDQAPTPDPRPIAKPDPKPIAKPDPKPIAKPDPKPVAKPDPKPDAGEEDVPSGYKDNPY